MKIIKDTFEIYRSAGKDAAVNVIAELSPTTSTL